MHTAMGKPHIVTLPQRRIGATDKQIGELMYRFCGLTDAETVLLEKAGRA